MIYDHGMNTEAGWRGFPKSFPGSGRIGDHLVMVLLALLCGLASGYGAILFRALIKLCQTLFYGNAHTLAAVLALPWFWRLLAPALGGLIVGPLVHYLAPEAKGHGVPEVMEAVHLKGGTIRPRVVMVKALASAVCIASGGSVGREGPIVQIGSALSSTIGQLFKLSPRQLRTLVACGAASGIAATFNAPIAGALFAVEIILGDFGVTQFSPIVISSVVATIVSRHYLGDFPAFEVPGYSLASPYELFPYMVLGVLAGFIGLLFMTVLYASEDFFGQLTLSPFAKAALGGLMVGAIGIKLPHVFGVGYETINNALVSQLPLAMLLLLLFAKILSTSITLGTGGSGGIFAPSLFMGAMAGGVLGTLVHQLFPAHTATSGAYALVGMGAFVSGVTHAPITAIIMIFELTDDYTIIPPLMAACVISTLIATLIRKDSIYTLKLRRRGVDLFQSTDVNVLKTIKVREVCHKGVQVIRDDAPFAEVVDRVLKTRHNVVFVVDLEGCLVGTISRSDLHRFIGLPKDRQNQLKAWQVANLDVVSVGPDETLDVAAQLLTSLKVDELPVVDPRRKCQLMGSIREADLVAAYNREMMLRDMAGCMVTKVNALGRARSVALGNGYLVAELPAVRPLQGKTLRELDLRARYGVEVILLRSLRKDGPGRVVRLPRPDDAIRGSDVLVVAGTQEAINRLKKEFGLEGDETSG